MRVKSRGDRQLEQSTADFVFNLALTGSEVASWFQHDPETAALGARIVRNKEVISLDTGALLISSLVKSIEASGAPITQAMRAAKRILGKENALLNLAKELKIAPFKASIVMHLVRAGKPLHSSQLFDRAKQEERGLVQESFNVRLHRLRTMTNETLGRTLLVSDRHGYYKINPAIADRLEKILHQALSATSAASRKSGKPLRASAPARNR